MGDVGSVLRKLRRRGFGNLKALFVYPQQGLDDDGDNYQYPADHEVLDHRNVLVNDILNDDDQPIPTMIRDAKKLIETICKSRRIRCILGQARRCQFLSVDRIPSYY